MKYISNSLCALFLLACSESSPAESMEPSRSRAVDAQDGAPADAGAGAAGSPASGGSSDPALDAGAGGESGSDASPGSQPVTTSEPRDASAGADSGGHDAAADGGDAGGTDAGPRLEFLEPMFFSLPINSVRYGVSGYDPSSDLCISVIWYLTDFEQTQYCGVDTSFRPYVWVEAAQPAGCWGYGPNAELLAVRGCVDFADLTDPDDDSVELEADISSPTWSGTVRFAGSP